MHDAEQLGNALQDFLERMEKATGTWSNQPRWPKGLTIGGQFKEYDSDGVIKPPQIGGGKSNPQYQDKASSLYLLYKDGNIGDVTKFAGEFKQAADKSAAKDPKTYNSHDKWKFSLNHYASELVKDHSAKIAAESSAIKIGGTIKLSDMVQIGSKPGGSNPGGMYAAEGHKVLVKGNAQLSSGNVTAAQSADRAKNEVLASHLMLAVGVGAPVMGLVDLGTAYGGGLGVTSQWMQGQDFNKSIPSHIAAAQQDFAVHAWLANYDAVGMGFDNLKMVNGKAVNIDPGGALLFRAQGLPKQGGLSPVCAEINSMRDKALNPAAAAVYGSMTSSQIAASVDKLNAISGDDIKKLVETHGPGDAAGKASLAAVLIARKADLLAKFSSVTEGVIAPAKPAAVAPAAPTAAPAAAPSKVAPSVPNAGPQPSAGAVVSILTNTQPGHNKLYSVTVDGSKVKKEWGPIGGYQMFAVVDLGSPEAAKLHAAATIAIKMKGGYTLDKVSTPVPAAPAKMVGTPQVSTPAYAMPPTIAAAVAAAVAADPSIVVTAAPAASAAVPSKPVFAATFATALKTYNNLASQVENLHAAGDSLGLTTLMFNHKAFSNSTLNGDKLQTYTMAMLKHLDTNKAAENAAAVQAADAKLSVRRPNPPSPGTSTGFNPAMPVFAHAKLPDTNSNAPSHNKKIDAIAALAASGDVKGIVALNFGTNTYGHKQVTVANNALAALGSSITVVAGQKASQHPAMTGGVPAAQAAADLKTAGKPPIAHPPGTMLNSLGKPIVVKPDTFSEPPDFKNYKGAGQGLSSKAWINEQNNKIVNDLLAAAKTIDEKAVKNYAFATLDANGSATGVFKPLSDHPSKHIKEYQQSLVSSIDDLKNPPEPLKEFAGADLSSSNSIAARFPSKKLGSNVHNIPKNEQFGFWAALGKVSDVTAHVPTNTSKLSPAAIKAGKAAYAGLSAATKSFIVGMQSDIGSISDAFTNGKADASYLGHKVKAMAKALLKDAVESPAGTTIFKHINFPTNMLQQLQKAEIGTVFDAIKPMCTSYHETATSKFGSYLLKIVYAPGAKAIHTYGSGAYNGEQEVSTLPHSRFVIVHKDLAGKTSSKPTLTVMMLPPDPEAFT
jgi:hypothetical protein